MEGVVRLFALVALVACGALLVAAPTFASSPRLRAISIEDHGGETLILLEIDGDRVEPSVHLLGNDRLVVDLPAAASALHSHDIAAGTPRLKRVRVGVHGAPAPRIRVVLDLTGPAAFDVVQAASGIQIDLREPGAARRLPMPPTPQPTVPTPSPSRAAVTKPAIVALPSTPSAGPPAPSESPDLVELVPLEEPAARATALPEPSAAPAGPPAEDPIPGGRLTIDFRGADVRAVIDLVANVGGYEVIFTPEVSGTITIRVVDEPWEDALETILTKQRLRATRHAELILVSPEAWD